MQEETDDTRLVSPLPSLPWFYVQEVNGGRWPVTGGRDDEWSVPDFPPRCAVRSSSRVKYTAFFPTETSISYVVWVIVEWDERGASEGDGTPGRG